MMKIIRIGKFEAEIDLLRLCGSTSLRKQSYLAQDHIHTATEYLQGGSFDKFSGKLMAMLSHLHSKILFPDVQRETLYSCLE